MSELPLQQRSRLEEAKVERRAEDEQYLVQHPEVGAAIRLISRVRNITKSLRVFRNIYCRHCYSSNQQKPLTEFLNWFWTKVLRKKCGMNRERNSEGRKVRNHEKTC